MVGCFFRVVERANRLLGTGLAAALFGAPELPRDLSSGVLTDWSPREAIELEETARRDRNNEDVAVAA